MFVLQRTGKVKVRYEIFSFFAVSKSSLFCGRSLGVVLLLVQTHLWVSGRPPPLWRLALATGSLRTGQTVTPFPAEAGRIVPNACKNYLVSLFRWSKSLPQRYSRLMPFLYFVNEVQIYEAVLEMPKIPQSFDHFVSLDSMCWFEYSKAFWPFMIESVFGRLILNPFHQDLFPAMTVADAAEAAPSALRTLWGVTPSGAWTVHQEEAEGFEGRADYLYSNDRCLQDADRTYRLCNSMKMLRFFLSAKLKTNVQE